MSNQASDPDPFYALESHAVAVLEPPTRAPGVTAPAERQLDVDLLSALDARQRDDASAGSSSYRDLLARRRRPLAGDTDRLDSAMKALGRTVDQVRADIALLDQLDRAKRDRPAAERIGDADAASKAADAAAKAAYMRTLDQMFDAAPELLRQNSGLLIAAVWGICGVTIADTQRRASLLGGLTSAVNAAAMGQLTLSNERNTARDADRLIESLEERARAAGLI